MRWMGAAAVLGGIWEIVSSQSPLTGLMPVGSREGRRAGIMRRRLPWRAPAPGAGDRTRYRLCGRRTAGRPARRSCGRSAGLGGPQRLPRLDGLAVDRVDGLGERGAGLMDGTSSRQTASPARMSRESAGTGCPSCCQRTQPVRSREISSLRSPENSQVRVSARISSTG